MKKKDKEEATDWRKIADDLARIVYEAGCHTYPSYLNYKKAVERES